MRPEIGINSKILERTRILPWVSYIDYDGDVALRWSEGDGFNGGNIFFTITDHVSEDGSEVEGENKIITTSINTFSNDDNYEHNSRESLASILTMVATINRACLIAGRNIKHLVRANEYSAPYFERFVSSGFYSYSDRYGLSVEEPTTVNSDDWILFVSQYPLIGLEEIIGRFASDQAAYLLATKFLKSTKEEKNIFQQLSDLLKPFL